MMNMIRKASVAVLALHQTAPTMASAQGGPGFVFKRPVVALGLRVGYAVPRAGGDLFDYTLDRFISSGADSLSTLRFNSPYVGGELAIRPWARWDLAVGFGWTRNRTMTEHRRWVDTGGGPIEQETTFQVVTGTLGAKYYLQDRGRSVGSLAWVPHRLAPFVGGGIGVASYEFRQEGDFVDETTTAVFPDYLESTGEGLLGYGTVGADLMVSKNAVLTAEARYSFSNASVDGSFDNFGAMDLAGLQLMIGFGFQF
jgi:hypothetical protein